jgi:Flp pilus assembly protein CpaB
MSLNTPEIGRSRRSRTYIVVGAILAVLAFGAAAAVASLPLFTSNQTGVKVVVAKNGISARTKIQASDLELSVVNPTPPDSFTDIAQVAGNGARVDIPAGAPVTANLIAQAPDLLSSSDVAYLPIPDGYVAVTVPTSEEVGVGGYVQLGDRIAVLATIDTSVFGATPGAPIVRTVFRDLDVIRVGPVTQGGLGASSQAVTSSLTVLMTGCDAEYMFWLLNNAVLKYELESHLNYGATPTNPDPACPTLANAGGVGPRQVNGRWHFTTV